MFSVKLLRTRFTTSLRYSCRQLNEAGSADDHERSQFEKRGGSDPRAHEGASSQDNDEAAGNRLILLLFKSVGEFHLIWNLKDKEQKGIQKLICPHQSKKSLSASASLYLTGASQCALGSESPYCEKGVPFVLKINSSGEGTSRLHQSANMQQEAVLYEVQKRMKKGKKWKVSLPECDVEYSAFKASLQKIAEAELLQKVEEEEREWANRTEDLITSLNIVAIEEDNCDKTPPRLTPEKLDLKRKTGKAVFRNITYNEGELDRTDVSMSPSPSNPHPFNPSKHSPPTYSRSIVPFVNHYPLLQTLVDVGVNLFKIEQSTGAGKFLLRLDMQKDVKPKLQWLIALGFEPSNLGVYLTRNPFFLLQDLSDMQARVNYLTSMKFSSKDVYKIINSYRYWLNIDVKTMDSRLGWIQQQFSLSGDEVRSLICKEARILMFGLGPLQRLATLFNKEFGFTPKEIKRMLLEDPRVFMMDVKFVTVNYEYVHKTMGLSNATIADHPFILRCSHSSIRNRHEFLKKLGRAIYEGAESKGSNSGCEGIVDDDLEPLSLEAFLDPSDEAFVRKATNTYLVVYNNFLRNH